ncbi:hypothetical protein [Chryseobacterium aurantiacum]|uniref:hypothetical protein n=1 Tax=Chryseobacterium aurantiacum TaxID=2116499 RepID=UPI000D125615|nr:hypothetical protein [Chryseobacterium aurantiacum]
MKKKNVILLVGTLFSSITMYSQVGINTNAPAATLEVSSVPGSINKADGIITPKLRGSELKSKDAAYGSAQTGAIIYITEGLLLSNTTPKTRKVVTAGYYYFNGTEWIRINDVGVAPLTKVAFNASGTPEAAIINVNVYKRLSFPTVNITVDPEIGTWDSTSNELTVSKRGVYTITASLIYENVASLGGATLIIRGGVENELSSSVAVSGPGPYTQRNNMTSSMVLNPGDKVWVEGARISSNWTVGKRSLNITFSEIN